MIDICQVKYLNNIIEQDHRFIKKITKPMMAFHSAQAMIAGIEKDALCDPLMCFGFYR
jgi:putative transposase